MESPKIFFAHLREMTERFDPRYVAFRRRTAEFRYPMARLSELLSALPEYGAGEAGIERTDIKQPRYIRITDINDDGELSPELGAKRSRRSIFFQMAICYLLGVVRPLANVICMKPRRLNILVSMQAT